MSYIQIPWTPIIWPYKWNIYPQITEQKKDFQKFETGKNEAIVSILYKQPPIGVPNVAVSPIPPAVARIYFLKVFLMCNLLKHLNLDN